MSRTEIWAAALATQMATVSGGAPAYLAGGKQYVAAIDGAANAFQQADRGSSTVVVFALP